MNKQEIYQVIRDYAVKLTRNHQTYTRADLAYELKDYGIGQDSFDIVKLVYEAYRFYGNEAAIAKAYVDNEQIQSLVDSYKACDYSEKNDTTTLSDWIGSRSATGSKLLKSLTTTSNCVLKVKDAPMSTDVSGVLTGTSGVQQVRSKADVLFKNYTKMIDAYAAARAEIKATILDFVAIRENILSTYRKYTTALIDAFGESIKLIAPQLFDFDSISYLNEQYMLQQIRLEYDAIFTSCSTLIGEINESFSTSIRESVTAYRQIGSNKLGMVVAGLNMVNHYLQTAERTNQLKMELVKLEANITRDVTTIKGDANRLCVIHKTLNELYIPRALAYYRYAEEVLNTELNLLLDSLYATNELKALREERNISADKLQLLEHEITDNRVNIDTYTSLLKQHKQSLEEYSAQYNQAKSSKPRKPFFLLNILSFGYLGKQYNRNIYDWDMIAVPVIRSYENILRDIKLDTEELARHREDLKQRQKQQKQLVLQISQLNQKILSQIRTKPESKLKLLDHLEPLLKLLRIAKEIIESSLAPQLLASVRIPGKMDFEIPKQMKQNVGQWAKRMRAELDADSNSDSASSKTSQSSESEESPESSKDQQVEALKSNVAQQFITTLESYGYLQAMYENGKLQQQAYKQELARLQNEFAKEIKNIEARSAGVRETLRRINTATNHEELKSGLLALAQGNLPSLTMEDIDQFLAGNKTIII